MVELIVLPKDTKMTTAKPEKREMQGDGCTILKDGTLSNADIMASLLENPAKETRKDYLARRALYMREFSLTSSQFDQYFA